MKPTVRWRLVSGSGGSGGSGSGTFTLWRVNGELITVCGDKNAPQGAKSTDAHVVSILYLNKAKGRERVPA